MQARIAVADERTRTPRVPFKAERPPDGADMEALTEGFRRRDAKATDQLFALMNPRVTALVSRLLAWQGDVDDIVQDVFVTALVSRKQFRGEARFDTWITRIAINRCRAVNRRGWLGRRVLAIWHEQTHASRNDSQCNDVHRSEDAEMVRLAVAKLPTKLREVIVLYYLEQRSAAEVGECLGITANAVDQRLRRARRRLAQWLGDQEWGSDS